MSDVRYVTAGKPATGGSVFRAPVGTSLPTSTSATLAAAFKDQGYISDEGLKNNNSPSSDKIKAWGGAAVLTLQTEKLDEWSFTLLNAKDINVLKTVYGESGVSGSLSAGIVVSASPDELPASSWVFDMVLRGNALKRVVLPTATITEISEITYSDTAAIGYGIKLSAAPDSNGKTHYEYIISGESGLS